MRSRRFFSTGKIAVLMAVCFFGGTQFADLATLWTDSYLVPEVDVRSQSVTSNQFPTSYNPVVVSPEVLKDKRRRLERKIFGGPRRSAMPALRPMDTAELADRYLGQEAFSKHYEAVIPEKEIRAYELTGGFEELPGYDWKAILLSRQVASTHSGLFVYHHGHDGSPFEFSSSNAVIQELLERNFDVLALSMPGVGWNRIENVRIRTWDGWGHLSEDYENQHSLFEMVDTGDAHFIKFFIEPVVASLDRALSRRLYARVFMAGHSGGGWTTTLAAALDDRIDHSISYAGTLPFFARRKVRDLGDAEQFDPGFYREFTYPLLYELASWGELKNRVHYQVYNSKDDCCYGPDATLTLKRYVDQREPSPERDLRVVFVKSKKHPILPPAFFEILDRIYPVRFLSETGAKAPTQGAAPSERGR